MISNVFTILRCLLIAFTNFGFILRAVILGSYSKQPISNFILQPLKPIDDSLVN